MSRHGVLPTPIVTATITGAITNRVKVQRPRRPRRQAQERAGGADGQVTLVEVPVPAAESGRRRRRRQSAIYDQYPTLETEERAAARLEGRPYVGVKVIGVSLPAAFLAQLDGAARRARKNRSHYIRHAVERLLKQEEG